MSSIYEFTLRSRKTFQGFDRQGNQGDLYYNGKKAAWYNDSGNGGSCDIVYYDNSYAPILEETIKRYFKERPMLIFNILVFSNLLTKHGSILLIMFISNRMYLHFFDKKCIIIEKTGEKTLNDKFIEFIQLLDKLIKFPNMTLSEKETELIKEMLAQILENNPNYGPQTKRVFKAILDAAKHPMELAVELQAYIATHNIAL